MFSFGGGGGGSGRNRGGINADFSFDAAGRDVGDAREAAARTQRDIEMRERAGWLEERGYPAALARVNEIERAHGIWPRSDRFSFQRRGYDPTFGLRDALMADPDVGVAAAPARQFSLEPDGLSFGDRLERELRPVVRDDVGRREVGVAAAPAGQRGLPPSEFSLPGRRPVLRDDAEFERKVRDPSEYGGWDGRPVQYPPSPPPAAAAKRPIWSNGPVVEAPPPQYDALEHPQALRYFPNKDAFFAPAPGAPIIAIDDELKAKLAGAIRERIHGLVRGWSVAPGQAFSAAAVVGPAAFTALYLEVRNGGFDKLGKLAQADAIRRRRAHAAISIVTAFAYDSVCSAVQSLRDGGDGGKALVDAGERFARYFLHVTAHASLAADRMISSATDKEYTVSVLLAHAMFDNDFAGYKIEVLLRAGAFSEALKYWIVANEAALTAPAFSE